MTRSVLITGGASGIGAAVARRVVASGGWVCLVDVNGHGVVALARELGERAIAAHCDALDEDAFQDTVASAETRLPPINGLVTCAGIQPRAKRIEDTATDEFNRLVESHLSGTFISCRVVGSLMASRGAGAIVNLASVLSFRPGPVLGYTTAKAAVVNLTQALAVQWAKRGVRVNAVAPGWTDTPFLQPKDGRPPRDLTPILNATPIGRLLQPSEIAEVIYFLLSPAASGVTGATVPVDGGVMAGAGWLPYGGFPQD